MDKKTRAEDAGGARTISSGPRMANCRWSTRLQGIEEAEPKPDWYSMASRGYQEKLGVVEG